MKIFEYDSNNSGGHWWLSDEDWKKLEKNGWKIMWKSTPPSFDKKGNYIVDKQGYPLLDKNNKSTIGGTVDGRWLGALATNAFKKFKTEKEAIQDFENITGQDYYAEGCSCCGRPHSIFESYSLNKKDKK